MLDGMLQCELSDGELERLKGFAREAGRDAADLAGEWIGEKLLGAEVPASPSPDQGPELHF